MWDNNHMPIILTHVIISLTVIVPRYIQYKYKLFIQLFYTMKK